VVVDCPKVRANSLWWQYVVIATGTRGAKRNERSRKRGTRKMAGLKINMNRED
jgi:hypothetical protein